MKNDEESKWYGTDYTIQEEEQAQTPGRHWPVWAWIMLAIALVVGILVSVWISHRQTRQTDSEDLWGQTSEKEISLIETQLREFLPPRQIGEDPTQRQMPAEWVGKIKMLITQGNTEQNALAKIALKDDNGADANLNALKRAPIAEAFRLITLEGHNWYNVGEFDRAVEFYEQALALQPKDINAIRNAAIAHSQAKHGEIAVHWKRTVELLTQGVGQVDVRSIEWCELQNNLGLAWTEFPSGDHNENLMKAIDTFHAAQGGIACSGNQAFRAKLQNNLGVAWLKMATGDREGNLHIAIAAFRLALEMYPRNEHPLEWAMVQNNLGKALMGLAGLRGGDADQNLIDAVAIFRSALAVPICDDHPLECADLQNNLGLALDHLSTGKPEENRKQAINAFQAAGKSYSRTLHPMEWASTRFNQAVALKHLADAAGKGCDHLWQSMAYLKAASSVWTPDAYPTSHQSQVVPFTQILHDAWRTRDCGTEKTLDGIPAAR